MAWICGWVVVIWGELDWIKPLKRFHGRSGLAVNDAARIVPAGVIRTDHSNTHDN